MCYEMLQNIINISTTDNVRPNVTRHDAIVGQFLFWTLHETGHAVFDIFQVPLFGREENAADHFAGYIMLHFGKDQARRWIEGRPIRLMSSWGTSLGVGITRVFTVCPSSASIIWSAWLTVPTR
jgi:hypothetical protein